MLDKKIIKEKLEKEKDILLEQMKDMAKQDPETGEWEAVPEETNYPEADQNDMADRFEEFESRSSMLKVLEIRLNNIVSALKNLLKGSYGKCVVCKKEIEQGRLEANPAAKTCKEHINS